jgi:hypothetical protein
MDLLCYTPWTYCVIHHGLIVLYTMGLLCYTPWAYCVIHHACHWSGQEECCRNSTVSVHADADYEQQ